MKLRIALLVPHIFMQDSLLKTTVFSPGKIALDLSVRLNERGHEVTIFTPEGILGSLGKKGNLIKNITGDWTLIQKELDSRGYDLSTLMQKHPLTYLTLSRQIQSELIANAYEMANDNKFDIIHVWINEEDLALNFAKLCRKPLLFTHHDPFNLLTKYRTSMWKHRDLNWISISFAQRNTILSPNTAPFNWVANIYHGISPLTEHPINSDKRNYFAYIGRIIEAKGVHLAIQAVKKFNESLKAANKTSIKLKIAGKHYADGEKNSYWENKIEPFLKDDEIEYVGFIDNNKDKYKFLNNAKALLIPSTFDEPFGLVMPEALSCGTSIIGLNNGAIPEVIEEGKTGYIVKTVYKNLNNFQMREVDEEKTINGLVDALKRIELISYEDCVKSFNKRFTVERMTKEYEEVYKTMVSKNL